MKTKLALYMVLLILFFPGNKNSQTWVSLGGGVEGPAVRTMEQYNGHLIAGGNFISAGGVNGTRFIAKWNGSSWSTVGPQNYFTGPVHALTIHNNELIAGGDFNPGSLFKIASWNGTVWFPLGSGNTDGIIYALFSWHDTLYAGGAFTRIGGVYADNIAKWDGSVWSPLGSGTSGPVLAITADGFTGKIVAGGSFNEAGGVNNVNNVAEWNGTYWSDLGSGLDGVVNALESLPFGVVAGGGFNHHICLWAGGSSWGPLGGGIDTGDVFTVSSKRNVPNNPAIILVGGAFRLNPVSSYPNIASYLNGEWGYVGTFDNYVYKIFEASPYEIYAAGTFTTVSGVTVNKIARLYSHIPVFSRTNLRKPIPDYGVTFDTMPGFGDNSMSFMVEDVNLSIDTVLHSNNSDLVFILKHNGIVDTVIYNAGGTGDNFIRTYLNDSATTSLENGTAPFTGQFRPYRPLSQFNGSSAAGNWILEIHDRASGNTGIFNAWSITLQIRNVIGIQQINTDVAKKFSLSQNYPNPFNPVTKLRFEVPKGTHEAVTLKIYDISGKEIQTLVNEDLRPGTYETEFNGSKYSSGLYFYRLTAGIYTESKKMVLVK